MGRTFWYGSFGYYLRHMRRRYGVFKYVWYQDMAMVLEQPRIIVPKGTYLI